MKGRHLSTMTEALANPRFFAGIIGGPSFEHNASSCFAPLNEGASLRGLTLICAVCDEIAHWESSDLAVNQDLEIIRAIEPGLLTTGGLLFLISTPWLAEGVFHTTFDKAWGQSTAELNPTISPDELAEIEAEDPKSFRSEYLCIERACSEYTSLETILACVDPGILSRPPEAGVLYHAAVDCSSGMAKENGDSFTAAVGHYDRSREKAVLDAIIEIKPPFDALQAVKDITAFLRPARSLKFAATPIALVSTPMRSGGKASLTSTKTFRKSQTPIAFS